MVSDVINRGVTGFPSLRLHILKIAPLYMDVKKIIDPETKKQSKVGIHPTTECRGLSPRGVVTNMPIISTSAETQPYAPERFW